MIRALRIAARARYVYRDDTFTLMVAPAIADLQFESPAGFASRVRGYVAVGKAMFGGLLHDFRTDVDILSRQASDLLQLVAIQVCYYATMLTLVGGAGFRQLSDSELMLIAVAVVGLSVTSVVLCFWPARYASDGHSATE